MNTMQIKAKRAEMQTTIEKMPYGRHKLEVWGGPARTYVTVIVESSGTRDKWINALSQFCRNVRHGQAVIEGADYQRTSLTTKTRPAWIVQGVI